ncbi:DUF3558 domain-containing protein [Streptomyces sp. NPDC058067]|uniref:DUF3558 domain-containing protein n=1 Tax=Streptomyces sp. NPDC058067 TaxID=3346324 RepID=UPI0036E72679
MQRKAYVPGVAALLAALLTGCTGGPGPSGDPVDSKPGDAGTSAPAARPGKYRTLPEPCRQLDRGTLDRMLPGIREIPEEDQRNKTYEGAATVTYDTDRHVGCRWKDDGVDASHRLLIDFERVVSYDNTVSDDTEAGQVFASKMIAAHLPEPIPSDTSSPSSPSAPSPPSSSSTNAGKDPGKKGEKGTKGSGSGAPSGDTSSGASGDAASPSADLQPRALQGLGDEAFLDDQLSGSASVGGHRTVTVVFRTSNVIVTIEYEQQSGPAAQGPDSKEMQDRAQELARRQAGTLSE